MDLLLGVEGQWTVSSAPFPLAIILRAIIVLLCATDRAVLEAISVCTSEFGGDALRADRSDSVEWSPPWTAEC